MDENDLFIIRKFAVALAGYLVGQWIDFMNLVGK